MTNPNEIPEIKGAEFARARERVGMSTADLAKMASLTTSHVEQIENGESSCFYSPAIKFVAAKKLATFLGLSEAECFVYPEGATAKTSKSQAVEGAE
jgi:cytoskeleton protein RodZ